MTRRLWPVVALLAAAVVASAVLVVARERTAAPRPPLEPAAPALTLLVVNTEAGPLAAVVGSTGFGRAGALVVPGELDITIPGQGDGTAEEAATLPPRQAATALANALGVWVDHYAVIGPERLAALIDRAGGIDVDGAPRSGEDVVALLAEGGAGRAAAFRLVLTGLLGAGVDWRPTDFSDVDAAADVMDVLTAAGDATVGVLPVEEVAAGVYEAPPDVVRGALVEVFGGPDREVVPVIVLNGSGVPGVGEIVAERIVPDGFRVVVNENASTFDHDETLVVVGSADDVALGERVRDLLGVGSVSVSVSSGIAPVTIVVGKDLTG